MVMTRAQKRAIGLDSGTSELCHLVFEIDLLREKIIDYVIHDDEGKLSEQNALSCRLVQKSWLESVFKCLVKSGNSLVELDLCGRYGRVRGLEQLLKIHKPSSRLPFKVTNSFNSERFPQDLKLLEKCLHLCGSGLVELKLDLLLDCEVSQKTDNPYDFTRQGFTFPVLQKLVYSVESVPPHRVCSNTDDVNGDICISLFLQSILAGCLRLKSFQFDTGPYRCRWYRYVQMSLPASFGNLLLPPTVTNLEIKCFTGTTTNHLETLIKNNLFPKVTDLTVLIANIPNGEHEWSYPLLNRVRDTLKNLQICAEFGEELVKYDLPMMKCLERIHISSDDIEWVDGVTNLQLKLPALREIDLRYATPTRLRKWVENSKFCSLTDVSIMFRTWTTFRETEFLTLELAQLMSEAFPKVTKLEISTGFFDHVDVALQCLFQSMTQLKILTVKLIDRVNTYSRAVPHPGYLDALLLGIPCQLIDTLKAECARGKLWDAVQLRMDKQFSVCNLSELRELSLELPSSYPRYPLLYPTFVSDKVNKFVASSLPNLQKINLPLAKTYSQADIHKWKLTERILNWD